ncbi:MAG TPA: M99 family metallo-carboxypeptidase C-terminal domain-containing protein [bacterium]|nr:M99 family metallo-carboxypeptidase C-terminal domain-containing protein [bacterium]
MVEFGAEILAGICVGISFLLLFLCFIMYPINRKKGHISLIITIVFMAVSIYYLYLAFSPGNNLAAGQQIPSQSKDVSTLQTSNQIVLIAETNDGTQFIVENGDSIAIPSNMAIKIVGITQNGKPVENSRANVIGFTPKDSPSSNNDIGYQFSYQDMLKKFAIDEEKVVYRVEIKQNDKTLGEIYLKFTR